MDTRGDDGSTVAWTVETLIVQGLSRAGLNQDSFKSVRGAQHDRLRQEGRRTVTDAIAMPGGTAYVRVGGW